MFLALGADRPGGEQAEQKAAEDRRELLDLGLAEVSQRKGADCGPSALLPSLRA